MSSSKQISVTPLCPQCDSEGLVKTDSLEFPVKCNNCGFETTEEHAWEYNEAYVRQKANEHAEILIEEELIKPLKKIFK